MDETKNSVAQSSSLGDTHVQLFDNPLSKDFIHLEELAAFLRVKSSWLKHEIIHKRIKFYQVGRFTNLVYLPEIREIILANVLAPKKGASHDSKDPKQKQNHQLSSPLKTGRRPCLQDLRDSQRREGLA